MLRAVIFTIIGYLSGSLLFAKYFGTLFQKKDITEQSPDKNPGTFNAFCYGGFFCGVFTLCGDVIKGFLPVYLYLSDQSAVPYDEGLIFVLSAPVIGHILPFFHQFRGGKGIAVSFGCLLGLMPELRPLCVLAGTFLFFSLVITLTPHCYRTLLTYGVSAVVMSFLNLRVPVLLGFFIIAGAVTAKHLFGMEEKEKCRVGVVWRR